MSAFFAHSEFNIWDLNTPLCRIPHAHWVWARAARPLLCGPVPCRLCHHSPVSAGDFQAGPDAGADAGMFPSVWLGETPGTRSRPRANPMPRIFREMTLPWVPPSAEAVEMVSSGSQLPAPSARLPAPPSIHPSVCLSWQQQAAEHPGTHLSCSSLLSPVSSHSEII